eukprot:417387_1
MALRRSQRQISCNVKDVNQCEYLQQLTKIMKEYNKSMEFISEIDISFVLNAYFHLCDIHNATDEEFEIVFNKFGVCNFNTCQIVPRNYRNRDNDNNNNLSVNDTVICEIMDKIHCHYQHCFDFGHKLLTKEKQILNEEEVKSDCQQAEHYNFINTKMIKMHDIISTKRNQCNHIHLLNKRMPKYHQLQKTAPEESKDYDKMYNFGVVYKYKESNEENSEIFYTEVIDIWPQHSSLKQELTNNIIQTISIKQFNSEYCKANKYWNSDYCQKTFVAKGKCDVVSNVIDVSVVFSVQHVLSLMVYCNYDTLQREFSKTYWSENWKKHTHFYHLGKLLQQAVNIFGTVITDGTVKRFYHGIAEMLVFQQYINKEDSYLHFNCPLSTSSSFVVALNFANMNNGLILQFGGNCRTYFSVGWLSNYGNESEFLFLQSSADDEKVQMNKLYSDVQPRLLQIQNIFEMKHGYEYGAILSTLQNIQSILDVTLDEYDSDSDDEYIPNWQTVKKLTSEILSNKLKYTDKYAKKLIDVFCENRKYVSLNYQYIKQHHAYLTDWIYPKLTVINAFFKNVETVTLCKISLTSLLMDDILHCVGDTETHLQKN